MTNRVMPQGKAVKWDFRDSYVEPSVPVGLQVGGVDYKLRKYLDLLTHPGDKKMAKDILNPAWDYSGDEYHPLPDIRSSIPAGYYIARSNNKGHYITPHDIDSDESYIFEDSYNEKILKDLDLFISKKDSYRERGFTHKRGYLLVGPQGSGKSAIMLQMCNKIIANDGIAIFTQVNYVDSVIEVLKYFKAIESDRLAIVVIEDIDSIIEVDGESEILQLLDGSLQVDGVFFIATTNYPEKLPPRIINRPRRFDKVEEIGFPNAQVRTQYLKKKLPEETTEEIERLVSKTAGMSYAAIAEYIISTRCLGVSEDETLENLAKIKKLVMSSEKFSDTNKKMGF